MCTCVYMFGSHIHQSVYVVSICTVSLFLFAAYFTRKPKLHYCVSCSEKSTAYLFGVFVNCQHAAFGFRVGGALCASLFTKSSPLVVKEFIYCTQSHVRSSVLNPIGSTLIMYH